jgi:hypothetical protein
MVVTEYVCCAVHKVERYRLANKWNYVSSAMHLGMCTLGNC